MFSNSKSNSSKPTSIDWASARGSLITTLVAIAIIVAIFVWLPSLKVYLLTLSVAGIAACVSVIKLTRFWGVRMIGLALVLVIVAGAVAVPWKLAQLERTGDPIWTASVTGHADTPIINGDTLLTSTRYGLLAFDLRTGQERWRTEGDSIMGFVLTGEGDVLLQESDALTLLSAQGEELWTAGSKDEALAGFSEVYRAEPVAARAGVVVITDCWARQSTACQYRGIDRGGAIAWSRDGAAANWGTIPPAAVTSEPFADPPPRQLPQLLAIASNQDTQGEIVIADTGDVLLSAEIGRLATGIGDTLVYQSVGEEGDECSTTAVASDGSVAWENNTPCLLNTDWSATYIVGTTMYGTYALAAEEPETFALDLTTGEWSELGQISVLTEQAEIVAGPGLALRRGMGDLAAITPTTGAQLWQYNTDRPGQKPGVDIGYGAVIVRSHPDRGHNPFTEGREESDLTTTVLDASTGRVTANLVTDEMIWSVHPVGEGLALVVRPDSIALIGTRP